MNEEYKPITNLWKDSKGYRYFGTLKLSSKIKYDSDDFIPLWEWVNQLQQENKQLKDNWNYIKKMLKEARQEEFNINGYCGTCTDIDIDFLLNKMQELEQGSDSND